MKDKSVNQLKAKVLKSKSKVKSVNDLTIEDFDEITKAAKRKKNVALVSSGGK
jgi:hypothetical protein